ncbi:uncharacterized protein [Pyxicephalus adspersus]|uniref:uncharacterized protein n=1 Tax=Pyxicephalus adspersus TaxID=30357 RepID=UPI003B59BF41
MGGTLWALIALCLVPIIDSASLPPAVRAAGRSELISEAIANYNKGSDSEFMFVLLADEDEGKTGPEKPKEVKFTIKETLCHKSEYKTTGCEYKAGGAEKSCRASTKDNHFTVVCTTMDATEKDGGSAPKEGEHRDQKHQTLSRTVIIEEKRVIPDKGAESEEEEMGPEDPEDEDYLADMVTEFHDDSEEGEAEPRSGRDKFRVIHGDILGRLLCLKCIIDIIPRI